MITLNNVPQKKIVKKVEYLPKKPIYPYIVPKCSKCKSDKSVVICTPSDPKQYYCFSCMYDFYYFGCLNCNLADKSPFNYQCIRCIHNPIPEDVLDEKFYTNKNYWESLAVMVTPFSDRWEPYKKIDLSWIDE